jgi:hypothetical protein
VLFYIGLPFAIAIAYAGQVVRIRERAIPIFAALFLAGPFGILFYNLFPALGPLHIFVDRFPWHPLTTGQVRRLFLEPVPVPGLRNAIPSLHLAWVLLAFWYSRGLSVFERSIAFAFVVFTVFATMGTGEHYFIDLIVAFPFALFMQALCATSMPWTDKRRPLSPLRALCDARLVRGAALWFEVFLAVASPSLDLLRGYSCRDRILAEAAFRSRDFRRPFSHTCGTSARRRFATGRIDVSLPIFPRIYNHVGLIPFRPPPLTPHPRWPNMHCLSQRLSARPS